MPASYRIDPTAAEYVRLLGEARTVEARDDAGATSQHVLYVERGQLRSMLLADWQGAVPPAWTGKEDMDAARAAYAAREAQQRADAQALRQRIVTTAQSAVGAPFDTLTAIQVRALLACLLYKAAALDTAGVVQPLNEWLK